MQAWMVWVPGTAHILQRLADRSEGAVGKRRKRLVVQRALHHHLQDGALRDGQGVPGAFEFGPHTCAQQFGATVQQLAQIAGLAQLQRYLTDDRAQHLGSAALNWLVGARFALRCAVYAWVKALPSSGNGVMLEPKNGWLLPNTR
jgi:hypothetical protein